MDLIGLIDTDPIFQADEAIMKFEIRERRMLHRIKRLTDGLTEKERRVLYELKSIKEAKTIHDEMSGKTRVVPVTRTELVESKVEEKTYRQIDDIISLTCWLYKYSVRKRNKKEYKVNLKDSAGILPQSLELIHKTLLFRVNLLKSNIIKIDFRRIIRSCCNKS